MFNVKESQVLDRNQMSKIVGSGEFCADGYVASYHDCDADADYIQCTDPTGEEESYITASFSGFTPSGLSPCIQ